ncbi:MAG: hypothetical protein WD716_09805 [Fimbriimonadaceae bacterium]
MKNRLALATALVLLPLVAIAFASSFGAPCCSVVSVDALKGTVQVRNNFTGRLMQINSAELAKTLKAGDALDADADMKSVTSIKGAARAAALVEPDAAAPCCFIVTIAKDKSIANALLSGIVSTGGKPYDAVAPFYGVVIAKDLTTGVFHVLDTSIQIATAEPPSDAKASPMTMSKSIDDLKVDDPVWISGKHGMFKSKGVTYSFKLRGAESDGGPWVVEPDPKAVGRFGNIRTVWHAKTSSAFQTINVYLPGKRDKDEYHSYFKTEHSVMEGEYDFKINGVFLENVPVKAGHATRILLGALHWTAPFANQLIIHDSKDRRVNAIQGGIIIALPIGTYHLKVGTRTVKVEIKENEITEF